MKTIKRFTASWCAPCKNLAMVIEGMDLSTPIEVIDIDQNQEVAMKSGIRSVPTLIMYDGETEVKRHTGVMTEAQLTEWING
jgi:thioredoxin 1